MAAAGTCRRIVHYIATGLCYVILYTARLLFELVHHQETLITHNENSCRILIFFPGVIMHKGGLDPRIETLR